MIHLVSTVYDKNLVFNATVNGFDVKMGGTQDDQLPEGPSPKKLMLASLAGCTGIDVVSTLQKMKVPFTSFSIDVEAELTDEHPKIYNKVKIIYRINVAEEDKKKMERAVSLSKNKYCGVSAMFSSFAEVTFEIVYI